MRSDDIVLVLASHHSANPKHLRYPASESYIILIWVVDFQTQLWPEKNADLTQRPTIISSDVAVTSLKLPGQRWCNTSVNCYVLLIMVANMYVNIYIYICDMCICLMLLITIESDNTSAMPIRVDFPARHVWLWEGKSKTKNTKMGICLNIPYSIYFRTFFIWWGNQWYLIHDK